MKTDAVCESHIKSCGFGTHRIIELYLLHNSTSKKPNYFSEICPNNCSAEKTMVLPSVWPVRTLPSCSSELRRVIPIVLHLQVSKASWVSSK